MLRAPGIFKTAIAGLLFMASLLSLGACGSGGAQSTNINTTTTMGQELIDLQASYDRGIITEREFNRARKDILDRYED